MTEELDKKEIVEKDLNEQCEADEIQENSANSPRTCAKWIPIDSIDHTDLTYHSREADDPDTIERYKAVWENTIGNRIIEKGTKSPFPEILVTETGDGRLIPADGWHRLLGGRAARISKIYGKVISGSPDELLKIAIQANSANGLPMSGGDLRHCIQKVQQLHPEWNPLIVVEFVGRGSPSYAAQIEKEKRESLQGSSSDKMPEKRQGKDGRWYPVQKKAKTKQASDSKSKKKAPETKPTKTKEKDLRKSYNPLNDPTATTPNSEDLAALFSGWNDGIARIAHVLDVYEKCLPSKDEKIRMHNRIKRWVGQRIDLCDKQNHNQDKTEEL